MHTHCGCTSSKRIASSYCTREGEARPFGLCARTLGWCLSFACVTGVLGEIYLGQAAKYRRALSWMSVLDGHQRQLGVRAWRCALVRTSAFRHIFGYIFYNVFFLRFGHASNQLLVASTCSMSTGCPFGDQASAYYSIVCHLVVA